jgi:hypothetical protein
MSWNLGMDRALCAGFALPDGGVQDGVFGLLMG